MRGDLYEELRQDNPKLAWEAEQLSKSYGIYLEYNRARTGREKDWVYMVRISIPGGGPITREQWRTLDDLSDRYAYTAEHRPSLRITTRQNLQFHWVRKRDVIEIVRRLAQSGLYSLNGCGDNVRNIMACPLASFNDVFNGNKLAHQMASFFRLPPGPFVKIFAIDPEAVRDDSKTFKYGKQLLNRKFKIAISSTIRNINTGLLIPDNCVELLTHDLGIAPLVNEEKLQGFQIYIGGGQGEKNGKPTMSAFAKPFAQASEANLLPILDAIVQVHQSWGDRQNRHWARLKYVVKAQGIDWYRSQVENIIGFSLETPDPRHDIGKRHLHHGWLVHPEKDKVNYGLFIENGRLTDESPNGRLKTLIRFIVEKYPVELRFTPNQDLIFTGLPSKSKEEFTSDLREHGYGSRHGSAYSALRLRSGACVGLDTCRLAYTESEKIEPIIIDQLERLGWGGMTESIGVTGCERQCFRPATKTIGLIGSGRGRYQFKLLGSENGRFQGVPVLSADGSQIYLRKVPLDQIPVVIDALFRYYTENRIDEEDLGAFLRHIGMPGIIRFLKENPATAGLMDPEPVTTSMESKSDPSPEKDLVPA